MTTESNNAHAALIHAIEIFGVGTVARLAKVNARSIERMAAGQIETPLGVVEDFGGALKDQFLRLGEILYP